MARVAGHPEALEWDRGNRTKSEEKHGFSVADVESIFARPMLVAGRIVEPASGEKRYLLLGVTGDGRYAALVFTRRGDKLRPISCRAMRRKEKEKYDAASWQAQGIPGDDDEERFEQAGRDPA